ncbi:UPF0254 family protein [Methanobacterium formicicum]|uniref:UPF0254 protein A994_07781 n=1 Tax=Methanobacterium formicicum (strain DSM 3637 / PP1) TaxID=1204725 RepID=K2RS53_METFP|nr:UPF0254 family protein [Methanobacterium formicicum]EKF85615.1 hypothetical protein A994_07781 [Methanobacterium formicicum DSM 3637]
MTITIATAECFTHGIIAREIHAAIQGYHGEFGPKSLNLKWLKDRRGELILLCGMFIPTLSAVKSVLKVNPPQPQKLINGIKVYQEEDDLEVAVLMARAVKEITGADIGIGTTAGIGRGGISIVTDKLTVKTTSDVSADLCSSNSNQLLARQKSGIKKTFMLLESVLRHYEIEKNFKSD